MEIKLAAGGSMTAPEQDLAAARAFLSLLDPNPDRRWMFRAIYPKELLTPEQLEAKEFPPIKTNSLERMAALNLLGYGAFVVINEGGHSASSITRVGNLFIDCDKPGDGHEARVAGAALPTSLDIESSEGKHHYYWFCAGMPVDEFTTYQKKLISAFDSDKSISDLSRVMRLPGMLHTKSDPAQLTKVLGGSLNEYPWAELKAWIDGLTPTATNVAPSAGSGGSDWADEFCRGNDMHNNAKKLIGRMVADGLSAEDIALAFAPWLEAAAKVSPERHARALEVSAADLPALYKWTMEREAERRAYRAVQDELNASFEGGAEKPEPEKLSVADMLDRFVFCARGQQVFDPLHPRCVLNWKEFRAFHGASMTQVENRETKKKQWVENSVLWQGHRQRKSVLGITFKAGGEPFVGDTEGVPCVNTWRGWRVKGVEGDASMFVTHVRVLFKDRAEDFLDWLSHIIQKPGVLAHTTWLHISTFQGTGRNWLSSVLLRVMHGNIATNVDLPGLLTSGYNTRISQMCLAIVDEIKAGGSERWSHAEKFKQMVTAETVQVNPKYGQQRMEFNACRWLLFSNHRSAIPLEYGDRRTECVVNDDLPLDEGYYIALYAKLQDPGFISAVMNLLATRDISAFNSGGKAKLTFMKQEVMEASRKDENCDLEAAHDTWPYALATRDDLAGVAGIVLDARNTTSFGYTLEESGWVRIGRYKLSNGQHTVYCRRGETLKWEGKSAMEVREGLGEGKRVTALKMVK